MSVHYDSKYTLYVIEDQTIVECQYTMTQNTLYIVSLKEIVECQYTMTQNTLFKL